MIYLLVLFFVLSLSWTTCPNSLSAHISLVEVILYKCCSPFVEFKLPYFISPFQSRVQDPCLIVREVLHSL
ncbi:hypothetical protein BKA70DRAFT_1263543 [Coprinopsis sp. MPI-PUGE-AT-0042]|nr:hypothetical protein BKA70DRAFT_1263543 [Coprinopsis sp. MPI-PUGE-AT-0042]